MICGSGGSKSRLAKAAGAEAAGQMRDEKLNAVVARSTFPSQNVQNKPGSDQFWKLRCRKRMKKCTPFWREAHFQVKMFKAHHARTTFVSCDVEKVWKSARRCGAKHISKSKCTKHTRLAPLLEVEMSKKCTLLWREAHFQVKMYKTNQVRTSFGSWDVEKVHAFVARSTFPSENAQNTPCSDHFWKLRCRKSMKKCTSLWREAHFEVKMCKTPGVGPLLEVQMSLHYTTLHYTTLHYTTLHYTKLHYTTLQLQLHNYTPLHLITLHYITLHSTPLDYITLHYTALPSTTLHYITLHSTTLQLQLQLQLHNYTPLLHYTKLHYTTLHYTTLHYIKLLPSTTLHYITLHYTSLHYNYNYNYNYDYTTTLHYTPLHEITLHYTTWHYTTLHSTTLHYTTLHYTTLHYTEWHCTTDRQVDR